MKPSPYGTPAFQRTVILVPLKPKMTADPTFVRMARSTILFMLPAYCILGGFVWGCIILGHWIVGR